MSIGVRAQLCVMMFLEFFIWGGWFVTLGTFLGNNIQASDGEIALAFSTQSWGAIIAPFIIGLIADRYFNAERILGVLHLIGAFLMYQMYQKFWMAAHSVTSIYRGYRWCRECSIPKPLQVRDLAHGSAAWQADGLTAGWPCR